MSSPATAAAAVTTTLQRLIIVRHGERLDNKDIQRFLATGTTRMHDAPLTDDGVQQGRSCGLFLRKMRNVKLDETLFVSSPLVRTVMTTDAILSAWDDDEDDGGSKKKQFVVSDGLLTWEKFLNEDMARGANSPPRCTVPDPLTLSASELLKSGASTGLDVDGSQQHPTFFSSKPVHVESFGEQLQQPSMAVFYERCMVATKYWWQRAAATQNATTLVLVTHTDVARAIHGLCVGKENDGDIPYAGVAELVPQQQQQQEQFPWFVEASDVPFFVDPVGSLSKVKK